MMRLWRRNKRQNPAANLQNPDGGDSNATGTSSGSKLGPADILHEVAGLIAKKQLSEANKVLAAAVVQFPSETQIWDEYTAIAFHSGDWREACQRARDAVRAFPGEPHYYAQLGWALHFVGRSDEGDQVLASAAVRFPRSVEVAREFARLALLRGDPSAALDRWESLRKRFPDRPEGYVFGVQPLVEAGRFDEAETLLWRCPENHTASYDFLYQGAAISTKRRDWQEAFRRWESLLERFPQADSGTAAIIDAVQRWRAEVEGGDDAAAAVYLPDRIAARVPGSRQPAPLGASAGPGNLALSTLPARGASAAGIS